MTKRMKKYSGRIITTAGVLVALSLLIWALASFAGYATVVGTYSDATYTTTKTSFARGTDTVFARMTGCMPSASYRAEYWGPSTNGGSDMTLRTRTLNNVTSSATAPFTAKSKYVTQVSDNAGTWEARLLHNPGYAYGGRIEILTPKTAFTAGTVGANTIQFRILDRDGNPILFDCRQAASAGGANLTATLAYATTTTWTNVFSATITTTNWSFNTGTGVYSYTPTFTATAGNKYRLNIVTRNPGTGDTLAPSTGHSRYQMAWGIGTEYDHGNSTVAGSSVRASSSGPYYKCIQSNTGIQPGVTAGWQSYWVQTYTTNTSTWSAVTAYTAGNALDTFAMGALTAQQLWACGTVADASSVYTITPATGAGLNPLYVSNPTGVAYVYNYYFDIYDRTGTAITTGTFTGTRRARGAAGYTNAPATQTSVTAATLVYDTGVNHWRCTFTLPAPGKYELQVPVTATNNTATVYQVVNYAASKSFSMLGDVTPPANITVGTVTPADNSVTLNWTNPSTDQGGGALSGFSGVLIVRDVNPISNAPTRGQVYDPAGVAGPNTIGSSKVVYAGTGTSFIDGNPCVTAQRLVNGTTYYYKAYSFDSYYNYSTGDNTPAGNPDARVTAIPVDTVAIAPVTAVSVTTGNMQNTINWTNPSRCDFAGVVIRYKTSGGFPTAMDGSDGSLPVGTGVKLGGTPGAADSFLHTSLNNGMTYYYTVWAFDDESPLTAGNYSTSASPASYAVPHDVVPPSSITDLSIVSGNTTAFGARLQWTSTGNDGMVGTASSYDIRYSKNPILTETDWKNAWEAVGGTFPQPLPSGTVQHYDVAGLSPLTKYYFAIKAMDALPNASGLSHGVAGNDPPSVTTLCNQAISACSQCHLMPPDDQLPGAHPRGTGNIGNHDLPIHAGNGDASQCDVCHANGNVWRNNTTLYQYTHQNGVIDMNSPGKIGNQYERDNNIGGTFYPATTIIYKYKNYSSGVGYKQTTGYCQNTYCHGSGLSSPLWGQGTIVCGEYCHETPPATGKHVKHYHPGQSYINFGPATLVSGYTNDNGTTGWSNTPSAVNRGTNPGAGGNRDLRYSTFISSSNSTKTFSVSPGIWYVTICVGDSAGPVNGQTVWASGDGGASWVKLIDNFNTVSQKLFKKVVDQQVIVSGSNNLRIKIGNGSTPTDLCFLIINSLPEAPKSNNTVLMNTASEYGFTCGKCHTDDTTQARHTSHVDGPVQRGIRDAENAFDGNNNPKNPLGLYTSLFGNISTYIDGQGYNYSNGRSCVNLYCHGTTLHAGGSNNTPTWKDGYIDVNGASICGACHDAGYADSSPLTNITTGSHAKHTNNAYSYRFDCYKCHNSTVGMKNHTTGVITITNKIYHVNGQKDVLFDPNDNAMKFGRYSSSIKTCNNVYCHSNGLLDKSDLPYWATTYASPQWASGSKTCNYCHGVGRADGMPHYANNSATPNSHIKHVDGNKLGCSKCHYNTTRDNGASIYTTMQPSLHANTKDDVTFDSENPTGVFNKSNLSCTGTYCHSASSSPTWGGVVDCGACHGSGTNPKPINGKDAHNAHNNGFYTYSADVKNNTNASNYDFSCTFCHYSRTHGNGPVVAGVQTAETNFNTVNVANGYNNSGATYIRGSAGITDTQDLWKYSAGSCSSTKCHSDGRGGAANNAFVTWTSKFVGTSSECYSCHNGDASAPAGRRMKTGMHAMHVFTSVYRRGCGECHNLTASNSSISDKSMHVNGGVEVSINGGGTFDGSKNCSNVYCHSNADPSAWGAGAAYYKSMNWLTGPATTCTSCHSNNHVVGGDGVRSEAQTLSFNHREHLNSATDPLLGGYGSRIGCTSCHNLTAKTNTSLYTSIVPSNHNNTYKDVYFYTSYYNMSGVNTVSANSNAYWGQWNTPANGNCTVICHSDARGGNPLRFPNWSTPEGTYGCTSCHAADATTFALPNYTGNDSHWKHVSPAYGNLTCDRCHRLTAGNNAGTPFINTSGFTSRHVNGSAANDVKFAIGTLGNYSTGPRSCSSLSCHGHRVWGQHYVSSCNSCHSAPPAYVQHTFHSGQTGVTANLNTDTSNATTYRFGCGKCHTLAATTHQGGNVSTYQTAEVKFDATTNPVNTLGKYTTAGALWATDAQGKTYTAGTCKNLYCHSNGQAGGLAVYSSIRWNTTAVSCTSCHGNATSVTLSTPHNKHVNTQAAGSYNFGCAQCHNRTVSSNTAISNKANHVNGVKDVFFATFGNKTGSYNAVNCTNTYCHSDGNGTNKTPTWSGTMTCVSCHNYTKTTTAITTGTHTAHINNADANLGSFRCFDCHNKTVMSNNSGITYTNGTHVNGAKDVYFVNKSLNNVTGAYVTGTKTCRSNYCHSSGTKYTSMTNATSSPLFRNPTWGGAALDCKGCHGADAGFTSLFGEPNYANRSTASRAWFNSHDKHVKSVTDCGKCHYLTTTSGTAILSGGKHINGSRDVNFDPAQVAGGSYDSVNKRCTVPTCHASAMRWGGKVANSCNSCHSDMNAGTNGSHSVSGKHDKHTNAATYRFACENCHATLNNGTTNPNTAHAGGAVSTYQTAQVLFCSTSVTMKPLQYDGGGTTFRYMEMDKAFNASASPVYKAVSTTSALALSDPLVSSLKFTQGRCTNVWCHSNANPVGGTNTYATYPNWSTAETTTCTSCHGDKASGTLSGKHAKHVNDAANGGIYGCTQCHNDTVSADTTISTYDNHVNGVKNVNFKYYSTTKFKNITGGYTAASYTCRNVYCHSSGQATPTYRTPAAWNSATAYTCDSCHGSEGTTLVAGTPEYANHTTLNYNNNSHAKHVSSVGDCSKCHRSTVNVLGNLSTSTTKHINGTIDVVFRADIGGSYNSATKTCSGTPTSCHGSGTPRWGQPASANCLSCHAVYSPTAETNDYTYNNGTKATVNFEEYTAVGHGKITAYRYTANTGANLSCESSNSASTVGGCHTSASSHGTTGNPFRLVSSATIKPTSPNTLCATVCHTSPAIQNHEQAITGNALYPSWFFTPKCVDCHDPHGDNGGNDTTQRNYAMVQGYINYSTNSSAYGVPTQTRPMDFPAETTRPTTKTRLSYATATYDGICQICHRRTSTAGVAFARNLNDTTHNSSGLCSDCHETAGQVHSTGFAGSGGSGGCKSCHNATGTPTTNGRRDTSADFSKKSHHVNRNYTAISPKTCAFCHAEANADGSQNATYHNVAGKAVILKSWFGQTFTGGTSIAGMTPTAYVNFTTGYGSSAGKVISNATRMNNVCLGCHSRANANSTPYKDSGDRTKPTAYAGWTNGTSIEARYNAAGTTAFSKYSTNKYNVVPQIQKAFSPHGNPDANQRDVAKNRAWTDDKTATQPQVACFDCHNSHGSKVGSVNTKALTSYSSAVGGYKGGILKEYTAATNNTASFTVKKYMPTELATGTQPYAASSALCFDCHLGDNAKAPKTMTYFKNKSSIEGYYDASRWQTTDKWVGSFAYKSAGTAGTNGDGMQKGGHFGASSALAAFDLRTTALPANINGKTAISGRCVKCHDPHGVSPNSANAVYRLPALKGTWMTSPYKEDRVGAKNGTVQDANTMAPSNSNASAVKYSARQNPRFDYNNPSIVGAGYGKGTGSGWGVGGTGYDGYFIDDNTFGTHMTYGNAGAVVDGGTSLGKYLANNTGVYRIRENTTQFAGLCLSCHNGNYTNAGIRSISDTTAGATVVHVHRTVKGWDADQTAADIFTTAMTAEHWMSQATKSGSGKTCSGSSGYTNAPGGYRWSVNYTLQATAGNTQSKMHQFPCSKCHAAHTSKLPRLMKTNCMDVGTTATLKHNSAYSTSMIPATGALNPILCNPSRVTAYPMVCHNYAKENMPTANRGWNSKTGW